jgi:hypothetical protein
VCEKKIRGDRDIMNWKNLDEKDPCNEEKMRPNKPGCWWWEDDNGRFHVAEFDEDMDTYTYVESLEDYHYMKIEEFEDEMRFKRWAGQAIPPKKVNRYDMDVMKVKRYNMDVIYGEMFRCEEGKYVEYGDVKEFIVLK